MYRRRALTPSSNAPLVRTHRLSRAATTHHAAALWQPFPLSLMQMPPPASPSRAGHHQPDEGQDRCIPCGSGKYQAKSGAIDCAKCDAGQNSSAGSLECTYCAEDYYRPLANSSATDCELCSAIRGVSCGVNTTLATLQLVQAHWRHTGATVQTWRCKSDGSWSPCLGGANAGTEGDGYCAEGYQGPRCELCDGPAYSRYFDKLDARCHDCGDMGARSAVLVCVMLLLILLAAASGSSTVTGRLKSLDACNKPLRFVRYVQTIWLDAGMRYKVKTLVGFYQCVAAIPSVYNVQPPLGLEHLTRWIHLLELPSEFERIFVVPTACLGDYRTRIWVGSIWPLVVILVCAVHLIGNEFVQGCRRGDARSLQARIRTALTVGLQRVLPPTLGLTFLVVPSTSTRIFRAFLCETFQYDEDTSRRYLYADLTLSCDTNEYEATRAMAFAMLVLWPVGIPLLYIALLWASRTALRTGNPTSLSRATAFLSEDYDYSLLTALGFWEPLEMCRKLTLTGWVLLIRGNAEQARVIVALFLSICFFGLNLCFRPQRRRDDASLTTMSHLALILLYTCVLTIKTCELSPNACESYGFGDSARGFFLFFIFFALSMLVFQLIFEVVAVVYHIRRQNKLRRLRHRGGRFVELPLLTKETFSHLPGLASSQYFHLFLSRESTRDSNPGGRNRFG